MLRIIAIIVVAFLLSATSYADTDGSNELSKKNNTIETKDCFEKINRGVFAFNQVVNDIVFEPLAKGYRKLPSPVRTGTSNALSNLSILLTLPNNILQGDILLAGKNSLRFVVNTTVGILGIFDPASKVGLNEYQSEDFGQTLGRRVLYSFTSAWSINIERYYWIYRKLYRRRCLVQYNCKK